MTLKQIKYIAAVAKYGSISKAASVLYISQPSLSLAIKKVEEEYDITIFERSGKGVILSHAGEELLKDIKHIAEYSEIFENKYRGNTHYKMMFCVASMHYDFALSAFLKLIEGESDTYNIGFLECKTLEVMENVERGIADVGIICFSEVNSSVVLNELKNRGIACHLLIERIPHIYMRKGHPLSEKENISWEDLQDFTAVSYYQGIDSSINFSNELIFPTNSNKIIYISDNGTLETILSNSDAYIVGTGIRAHTRFFEKIVLKPIEEKNLLKVMWISRERSAFPDMVKKYIKILEEAISEGS
ncbi:MAG: LysR family transcriptional regulator [Clostridiaceae bacterium]|jgi:DNA-binding transcriptional LysR family regulator|nr:LysR family transcriptional regulator [Clostridiaceae bacterium]